MCRGNCFPFQRHEHFLSRPDRAVVVWWPLSLDPSGGHHMTKQRPTLTISYRFIGFMITSDMAISLHSKSLEDWFHTTTCLNGPVWITLLVRVQHLSRYRPCTCRSKIPPIQKMFFKIFEAKIVVKWFRNWACKKKSLRAISFGIIEPSLHK